MIHRQKSQIDLLDCPPVRDMADNLSAAAEKMASSDVHVKTQIDREARQAFVDSLKRQIEADDYWIDGIAVAHCLQRAPLTNALLLFNTDVPEDTTL